MKTGRSTLASVGWGLALVVALVWPGRIAGPLDGIPFDAPIEAIGLGVVLPTLWVLYPRFLSTVFARLLIAVLIAWKAATFALAPQTGWCGMFLTKYPPQFESYRLAPGWDVRTWNDGYPPRCTAIVARAYTRLTQFPAWSMNVPFGHDHRLPGDIPDPLFLENPLPPEAEFRFHVDGSLSVPAAGTFSVETGQDTQLHGTIDGRAVSAVGGATLAVPLEAGHHVVRLMLDLTGRAWLFVPRWNGQDVFRAAVTTTDDRPIAGSVLLKAGAFVTPLLVLPLLVVWATQAIAALAPGWLLTGSVAGLTALAALAASSDQGPFAVRLGVVLFSLCVFVAVPKHLRNWRGVWLVIGVPWLVFVSTLAFRQIGGFTLFTLGDDTMTFQRFAYRIFLQGFWLEGGERTFWQQPLYRWTCGALHALFGDSSFGEQLWDAFGLLVGGIFAFEVTSRMAGYRAGVVAALLSLITFALAPTWYMFGRGLSEISASMWLYLTALTLLWSAGSRPVLAAVAGLFAVLAFYTRLNHLPLTVALLVLTLPRDLSASDALRLSTWRQLRPASTLVYLSIIAAGIVLFSARTWYFTGSFNLFTGTTLVHNGTGFGLTLDSWQSLRPWRNALESVAMIVTVQDPPRFDIRALFVVTGVVASLAALLRVPIADRLPLGVAVMCVAAIAGGLVARGVAYPGRFSIHLIPVAVAAATTFVAIVARVPMRHRLEAFAEPVTRA